MHDKVDRLASAFGDLLRQHRTGEYSQQELAERVGTSRSSIKSLEAGRNVNSHTLFESLVLLDIDHIVLDAINEHLDNIPQNQRRQRKTKLNKGLDNDF